MPHLSFTVDSALLEELGERLVGKPYIALAELVKNAYDADATKVTIEFSPENDRIAVHDNGHGMTFKEFRDFWMRVGSPHKQRQRVSKGLKRPMTGSKGVGRLAVQLLAKELELRTLGKVRGAKALQARVTWEEAVRAGDLTQAKVFYDEAAPEVDEHGTSIILKNLRHQWTADEITGLAQEIWWLQPPFRAPEGSRQAFEIEFEARQKDAAELFDMQLRAILNIWHAVLVGKNVDGKVMLGFKFSGEDFIVHEYTIPNCELRRGDFEIRLFHLKYRQPQGIKVDDARKYFNQYGGVHVYDAGFHLPFYGTPDNDWLGIQWEQAQRRSRSRLLPQELQMPEGLNYLPTLSRVFGVVNVNTSEEPSLNIMITRDRLQDNKAFKDLAHMVRYALHFYAMQEAKRTFEARAATREIARTTEKVERVDEVLSRHREDIPKRVYTELRSGLEEAVAAVESEAEEKTSQLGLLGSLATAGISSLAYQHELSKQLATIDGIVDRLGRTRARSPGIRRLLRDLRTDLAAWVERARATNALLGYLADAENTATKRRFRAKRVVDEVWSQVRVLARGVGMRTAGLDRDLLLPKASLVEWSAILQNVFLNALNAMTDSERRQMDVRSSGAGKQRQILVQDTGSGVDLDDAEELFKPLVRKLQISPERRALGYGGTGLGLTIVDLVASNVGCKVAFVEPTSGFSTAFSISWREK